MTEIQIQGAALAAAVVAMAVISWGATDARTIATAVGGVVLAVGLGSLTVLRFASPEEDDP